MSKTKSKTATTMDDSKFGRMVDEEMVRWLKNCGEAGGSLSEFTAHLSVLMQTNSEWRSASAEHYADELIGAWKAGRKRMPKSRPIKERDNTRKVHHDHATVRDLYGHADFMQKRAKTKTERAEAERMMDAADVAKERAGGDLDMKLRDIWDQVWPATETRQ